MIKHWLEKVTPNYIRSSVRRVFAAPPRRGETPTIPNSPDPAAQDTSQHGEIAALNELIAPDFPEYLVDVGAHDGKHLSNSWPFIQSGWRAITIEPLPKVFEQLSATHRGNPNVICVRKACSNSTGVQKFFLGSDGAEGTMSTLCMDDNEWFQRHRSNKSIDVEVDTLTNVLAENDFPKDFSLLLVDAEGMDYEVLLGLDFDRFQPRIIVTEEYVSNPEKHSQKYQLLRDHHYILYREMGANTIWVQKRFLEG